MLPRWVAAPAVLVVLFAGCFSVGSGPTKVESGATLGEVLLLAQAEGKAWRPGAVLTLAVGVEGVYSYPTWMWRPEIVQDVDREPGDGRAPMWTFVFADSDGTLAYHLAFAMTAHNRTFVERWARDTEVGADAGPPHPGTWTVDSDDAMAAAKANQTFAARLKAMKRPVFAASLIPQGEEMRGPEPQLFAADFFANTRSTSVWMVTALPSEDAQAIEFARGGPCDNCTASLQSIEAFAKVVEEADYVAATVDANSAVVLGVEDLPRKPSNATPSPEGEQPAPMPTGPRTLHTADESGQVTLAAPTATFTLPVAEDGATIEGNFTYGQGTLPGGATMSIVGADGTEIYSSGGTGVTIKETRVGVFAEDVPMGEYTVTVEIGNFAATADWTFDLRVTATGMPPMGNGSTPYDEEPTEEPSVFRDPEFGSLLDVLVRML